MDQDRAPEPRLIVPAALLRVWEEHGRAETLAAARGAVRERPGVLWPRPNLCAVVPEAGDPAVFDAALVVAAELLSATAAAGGGPGPRGGGLRFLLLPGQIELPAAAVVANPLLEETERRAPALEAGKVFLTTHAAARLEVRRKLRPAGTFQGLGGLRVPLVQALGEDTEAPPYRNPRPLKRRSAYVPRPELDKVLASPAPRVVVTGPAGCGKTRAVWEALAGAGAPVLWTSPRPARQAGPTLTTQLLLRMLAAGTAAGAAFQGLADLGVDDQRVGPALPGLLAELGRAAGRPPVVVVDGLEGATAEDLAFLAWLAETATAKGGFRLVAAGRSLPAGLRRSSALGARVEPLPAADLAATLSRLGASLSLPAAVQTTLLEVAHGNPFALEEGLTAMVQAGLIRQVLGSFFFGGSEATTYLPSERLVQHAEAEARRLGGPLASRLLAVAGLPVPPQALAAAGGEALAAGWAGAWVKEGWAEAAPSAWGPGLVLACPALAAALRATLPGAEAARLRLTLGKTLPAVPQAAWPRYALLATSPLGLTALLEAVAEGGAPPEALFQALAAELDALRKRAKDLPSGQPQLELLILWHLLPLARKLGRLRDLADELTLARALAQGDSRKALALAGLAAELEEQEGRLADAEATLRQALSGPGAREPLAGAVLVLHLARLLIRQEHHQEAGELLERVLPHLGPADTSSLAASCLFHLGNVAVHQRRLRDGLELHERALAIRRHLDKPKAVGSSLSALGRIALLEGRYPAALAHYREAESVLAAAGDPAEVGFALLGIAKALSRLGDFATASAPLRRALALREASEDASGAAIARLAVAENYFHLESFDSALEEARRAQFDLRLQSSLNAALGDAQRLIGEVLLAKRQWSEAASAFAEAVAAHRRVGDREAILLDLTAWLDLAMAAADEARVERLAADLGAFLGESLHLERREIGELRLYQALAWLARRDSRPRGALPHLRLAYRLLLAKADGLSPTERHTFLFRVREHQEIVALATQEGLTWPAAPGAGRAI